MKAQLEHETAELDFLAGKNDGHFKIFQYDFYAFLGFFCLVGCETHQEMNIDVGIFGTFTDLVWGPELYNVLMIFHFFIV